MYLTSSMNNTPKPHPKPFLRDGEMQRERERYRQRETHIGFTPENEDLSHHVEEHGGVSIRLLQPLGSGHMGDKFPRHQIIYTQ